MGASVHCKSGIPKGESLSPVLGALYLTPLDYAMERWLLRGDCFYARFQDDIIFVSRKRHVLKRMRKEMFQILDALRLSLRHEKTFMGRSQRGFDLLGYTITLRGFLPSQKTQGRAIEVAKRRYAQGGHRSLQMYLNRWRTWVHAGLSSQVLPFDAVLQFITQNAINSKGITNSQRFNRPHSLCPIGGNIKMKGRSTCVKKFSEHQVWL